MKEKFELVRGEAGFPERLERYSWCPDVLYGRGDPRALDEVGVAVIGSRRAQNYGLDAARCVAGWSVNLGLSVISGLSVGCDAAAHESALDAGGVTVGVSACGADIAYPKDSESLVERICERGCVVSPFEWGTPPARYTFTERNRLMVALANLLVVVSGRMPSATFSAVNWAAQLGVDIAAVPGSIFDGESSGPHYLIANGATALAHKEGLVNTLVLTVEYQT